MCFVNMVRITYSSMFQRISDWTLTGDICKSYVTLILKLTGDIAFVQSHLEISHLFSPRWRANVFIFYIGEKCFIWYLLGRNLLFSLYCWIKLSPVGEKSYCQSRMGRNLLFSPRWGETICSVPISSVFVSICLFIL